MDLTYPEDRPVRGVRALFRRPRSRAESFFASVIGRRNLPNMPGTTPDGGHGKLPPMPGTIPDRGHGNSGTHPGVEESGPDGVDDQSSDERKRKHGQGKSRLSELKPGESGVVAMLRGNAQGRLRLMEMGLTPGAHVKVLHAAAFGGPLQITVRGYQLSLRREEASAVFLG